MHNVYLTKGKEKPVLQHHNWVYSGAIKGKDQGIKRGDLVRVLNSEGSFLAYGYYNPDSKINVRLLEWNEKEILNDEWWEKKISNAIQLRDNWIDKEKTDSYRLIFSEGDALPGLIVDKYNDYLSVQFLTAGMDVRKDLIIGILLKLINPKGIYERSDVPARQLEGLSPVSGLLAGEMPAEEILIKENGLVFSANITDGQKSGYFLDQRENRKKVAKYCKEKSVLDCFSYTGGFSIQALHGGAKEVWSVDSSALAIKNLQKNFALNGLTSIEDHQHTADVFEFLRNANQQAKHWDVIILDPPKFAPNRQSVGRAERAYKDLNMQAIKLLNSGDLLASFSCSGSITLDHFKQILSWAAKDAGKELQFLEDLGQPFDHPVRAAFPESYYLKGVIARVL